MSREEQMETACSKVEEVLEAVKVGEMCLLHPSLNDRSKIQFHPAYGLMPVTDR